MGDKEDYLTAYRVFFENFAATVNPEDQLPVHIAGYTITESELPGEVLYWTTQYLTEKQCPPTLMTPLRRIILDEVQIASKKTPNDFGYKSDEGVYIALRLMQAVTARVNTVCLRYLDNARLDTLPPPPALRDMKTVSCATKNSRRAMEDRHVEVGNLEALFGIETTSPTSFYAVYDGHAGSAAATYCAAHLHQYLVESPHFGQDLQRAMREAFLRTDAEFVRKSNQDNACGGSTAVAVAIRARKLLAAWAGDSLALLAKRMRLMQLVRPHKPGREDERDRIESSGGTVMYWGTWRVNGQLAVSRAIGDAQYKPYVTARPEMMTVDLDGDEDFVVVACDGLWDFVSEDDVAIAVYRQLAADPDDLKAVTKRLIAQAKRQGSADNISIIVVFLKEPRDIAADNPLIPPMDLGLNNALANAPPFAMEAEACKRQLTAAGDADAEAECADAEADNGVDNSDSDSEDLGPETAVDADDLDADARPRDPAPPTPPADAVEEGHVDGALLDNVAESGEESEDEWNYFKGEGDREEQNPSEGQDEAPRSETPCQDNGGLRSKPSLPKQMMPRTASLLVTTAVATQLIRQASAWETSSVDMNSSPLNPDAPVFIPGSVAGGDVLLAESPRKPVPMDDIELPDVAQFETGAIVRPAELLDLDNCDQLNGHHNVSLDEAKEQLNGNNKYNMDSLGFGFSVGMEPDKVTDTGLIQDFERIQKDTTDFCNIQVFQAHSETNPFATEDNDELLERLKNKERDPMSMSFYQEKDDDTCERLSNKESHVDLNAVQTLPDSDDEDIQPNGVSENATESEKENISPELITDLLGIENDAAEPNNDIIRFDERKENLTNAALNFGQCDNFMDFNVSSSNMQGYSNIEFERSNVQDAVAHTDTPESHKLLFEQIPEIPDGKSSELGFATEDLLEQTESEKDARNIITPTEEVSQDIDMETRNDDSPCIEEQSHFLSKAEEDQNSEVLGDNKDDDIVPESELLEDNIRDSFSDRLPSSPLPVEDRLAEVISPEVTHNVVENSVEVDVHQSSDLTPVVDDEQHIPQQDVIHDTPHIKIDAEEFATDAEINQLCSRPSESPMPAESPLPSHSPLPSEDTLPVESPVPVGVESPVPVGVESPVPPKSPFLIEDAPKSPAPAESPAPPQSPLPAESPAPAKSPSPLPQEEPQPVEAADPVQLAQSPEPEQTLEPPTDVVEPAVSPAASPAPVAEEAHARSPSPRVTSPRPADVPLPRDSPAPASPSPALFDSSLPVEPSIPREASPQPEEPVLRPETASPLAAERAASSPSPVQVAALQERLSPEVAQEVFADDASAGPAPDIVPDVQRSDLVTDIDIGIPESRAQEICVPVTSEIRHEDGATPPPTPAAAAPALHIPPVSDTPIAADSAPALAAAAVAATAGVAVAAAVGAKKTIAKKSPTTPTAKPAPKTPARTSAAPSPRTPASAAKKPATATTTPARSSTAARTPASATKPAAPKAPAALKAPAAPRTSAASSRPAAPKPASAPAKEPVAAARTAPTTARAPAARPAPKAPAPRPTSAAAAPKPATKPPPITRPTGPRPATAPAPRAAPARPKPTETKPKPAEKKPLANGDVKDAKPAPKPAAPRVPATARPAPRPAPRAPAPRPPAAAAPASATTKTAAPKPLARAAAARPLDKQSKDLANKRITAKAAPPRTNATKPAPGTKSVPVKVPRRPEAARAAQNGLTNGAEAEPALKPPPSPPAADNALLPDVIA